MNSPSARVSLQSQKISPQEYKEFYPRMTSVGFFLYRLNLVDRQDLFPRPIANDHDLIKVIETAATRDFDVEKIGRRSTYRWALREPLIEFGDGPDSQFVAITFSREIMSRRGPIVGSERISHGVSTFSPPPATLSRILVHLKRHIFAIEDVSGVIAPNSGWRKHIQTILDTAAWHHGFTSMIQLSPVTPTETISQRASTFERITRLRVTLRIPNPDLGPAFQRLFDEMSKGGVRELTQDMRNERSLNVQSDALPKAAIEMATSGYRKGTIRLYGTADGRKQDLVIGDEVARIEVTETGDLADVRSFVEGYAAGHGAAAVKRFAKAVIERIDENLNQRPST